MLYPALYPLRSRSLYPFVLDYFAGIPAADRAKLRVLDCPAGSGILSVPLAAAGFAVTPADLFPEYLDAGLKEKSGASVASAFEAETGARLPRKVREALWGSGGDAPRPRPGDIAATAADMESRLPFPDASFDIVLCVEGIEHVQNRHATLAEFRRVLAPGGRLLITTPNLLSMRARAAYFLSGQRALKSWIDEHTSVWGRSPDGRRTYHGHAFLINYFQLRYSLHHSGFRLSRVLNSNWSPTSVSLSLLIPLVWLGTTAAMRRARERFDRMQRAGEIPPGATPPYDEMRRHLLTGQLLFNATLIAEGEAV
jgi:2-polyprenyl-3-methyl-5-hydroxy-6-metoxy-1,4-benzoquinol methylase